MFCKNCGSRVANDSKFCVNCGAPVSENAVPESSVTIYHDKNIPRIDEYMEQTEPTVSGGIVRNIFFFLIATSVLLLMGRLIGYVL